MMITNILKIALLSTLCISCVGGASSAKSKAKTRSVAQIVTPTVFSYIVKATFPHKTDSYTQGLLIHDGQMWESTGLNGESRLMRVDLTSGTTQPFAALDAKYFGEGITIFGDVIYYLTWREGVMFRYNLQSGKELDPIKYSGEGWGLTSDENSLYMSDGSSKITVRNPQTFDIERTINVTIEGEDLAAINELEWIDGRIWANVYYTNSIVIINPQSGVVEGVVNLNGLLPDEEYTQQTDVLNGIAHDKSNGKIYVTGKNWPKLFEIEVVEF